MRADQDSPREDCRLGPKPDANRQLDSISFASAACVTHLKAVRGGKHLLHCAALLQCHAAVSAWSVAVLRRRGML